MKRTFSNSNPFYNKDMKISQSIQHVDNQRQNIDHLLQLDRKHSVELEAELMFARD